MSRPARSRATQLRLALQETYRRYQAGYIGRATCRAHLTALWQRARAEGLDGAIWGALQADPGRRP